MAISAEILLDTSAAVPFLLRGHPAHADVQAAVSGRRLGLAGHAAFETYSVITRLAEPTRVSPLTAQRLLSHNFPRTRHLSPERAAELTLVMAEAAIAGGSVYDALVGATALEHRRTLASRDQRALVTYAAIGVDVMLID